MIFMSTSLVSCVFGRFKGTIYYEHNPNSQVPQPVQFSSKTIVVIIIIISEGDRRRPRQITCNCY